MEDSAEPMSSRSPTPEATGARPRLPDAVGAALEPHLPPPPSRLLLLGPPEVTAELASVLEGLGHSENELPPGPARAAESPPPDARPVLGAGIPTDGGPTVDAGLIVFPDGAPSAGELEALRGRVRKDGRVLILRQSDEPGAADETVRRLYETRWVVLEDLAVGDGIELLVARPGEHRIRAWRPGDEEAILDLFERAFHHRRSPERWRWAYAENPWGNGRITLAEDPAGRLVAHYAGYPIPFWTNLGGVERTVTAHHVGDTMTAPDARRVGRGRTNLLTRTVRHFYATWCRGRIAFNYGSNTGKIQRFSRRTAGARRVEPVPYRVRPLGDSFDGPGAVRRRIGGWRAERLDGPDERWDDLWRRARGAYRFLAVRDRRALEWRLRCPETGATLWAVTRRGLLVGWSVVRRVEDRLVWGDALFDPRVAEDAAALLLSEVAAAEEHRGCTAIEGWLPDRPAWWSSTLASLGFREESEPQDLGLVYVPFEEDPGEEMAAHLYYTKADFDLF